MLIHLVSACPPRAGKLEAQDAVASSIRRGALAALHADVTADITREGKQSSKLLLHAMHALARGDRTAAAIARRLGVDRQFAANMLVTLEQLGITESTGRGSRRFAYPLMREWLLAQPVPPVGAEASEKVLRTELGFDFEARVREALAAIPRPIRLQDDAEGETLLHTRDALILGPFLRVTRRQEEPETDAVGEEGDRTLVLGCRYRREQTTREDIRSFADLMVRVAAETYPGVYPAYVSGAGFTQGAIQEALARNVTLLTLKALNELMRAVGHQPFTPPSPPLPHHEQPRDPLGP